MIDTELKEAVMELKELHINEQETMLLISEIESIFVGKDDFSGFLQLFLDFKIR